MNKLPRIAGLLSLIAGIIMIIAGLVTWNIVTSQLKDERIDVPNDAKPVMGMKVAGKQVKGPITAFGQAEIIKEHALKASGGKTYAELGDDVNAAKAELEKATTDSEKEAAQAKVDAAQGKRNTVMNGAFLRSSLFSSVITYGVAALVAGLGLLFSLIGLALMSMKNAAATVVADRDAAPVVTDRDGATRITE